MWKNDITAVSLFAICRCFIQEACHRFRKKEINFLAQQTICLRTLNEQTLMRKSLCFYWRKFQSPLHSLSCLNEIFLVASWPSTRKRKWLQNNVGNKVHWWWNTDENIWNTAMHPIFWRWITSKIYFFLSSAHPPLHHSIPYEFSHPCCPSQRIFPPPAAQTLVPFSGNNWSVDWYFCPASLYYLLDVLGSGTLAPLSIRIWRSLHHGLCIVFSVFDDDDGHYRGHTSRHVVGAEVKKKIVTLKRTYIIVATIWILSLVSSLCALLDDRITLLHRLITIPLCLVISLASYAKIFRTLRYHQVQAEDPVQQQPRQRVTKTEFLLTISIQNQLDKWWESRKMSIWG